MKYFFKHLLRTIKAFPIQPILILLTVTLSVAVAVTAVRTEGMFSEHAEARADQEGRLGDLIITVPGDSEVRMLFSEDAEPIVGERAQILGEYTLTAYYTDASGGHLLSVSSVDLAAADAFFDFSYTEYGRFTAQELDRSIMLSSSAASQYGLHVGDTVTLRLLNIDEDYTVQAIAEPTGLFSERDILLPITAAVRLLSRHAPELAALGNGFSPYNRLILRADPAYHTELFEELSSSEAFRDRSVELTSIQTQTEYLLFWQMNIVRLLALSILLLCGILIGTALSRLRTMRTCEIALFCSIGASRRQLWLLQLMENALYALLGSAAGALLAIPLIRHVGRLFAWQREPLAMTHENVLFGFGFAGLLMLGFSLPSLLIQPKELCITEETDPDEVRPRRRTPAIPIAFCLIVPAVILCFALPTKHTLIPGITAALVLIWLLYLLTPYLLRGTAELLARLQQRRAAPKPTPFLSLRNLKNHPTLSHSARLFAVLLAILSTLTVCRGMLKDQIDMMQELVRGEMIAVGLPNDLHEELEAHSAVTGVMPLQISMNAELEQEYSVIALSANGDLSSCLHPKLIPDVLPQDGQAAVSVGIAALLELEVGDRFSISLGGVEKTYTVCELLRLQAPIVMLPTKHVGSERLTCIRLRDNVTDDELNELLALLESRGVMMTDTAELLGDFPLTMRGFSRLLSDVMLAGTFISAIGIANLLIGVYHARTRERALLSMCGMTRGQIIRSGALELIALFVFAVLIAAPAGATLCLLLDRVMRAAGMALFV